MADLTPQQRLDGARAAYYAILTGTNVIKFIDMNGESVQYGTGNIDKLAAYITALEQEVCGSNFRPRRAIGFIF